MKNLIRRSIVYSSQLGQFQVESFDLAIVLGRIYRISADMKMWYGDKAGLIVDVDFTRDFG